MVFGEVVLSFIGTAFVPKNVKVFLVDMIMDPIKAHINDLGAFLFDGVISNARCSTVISLDGSGRLRMTQFFRSCANGAGFLVNMK